MKKNFVNILTVIGLAMFIGCSAFSGGATNPPPSLDIIEKNVLRYSNENMRGIKVVGLHKKGEGSYIIITNKSSGEYGGPYELLRLESGDWVMQKPVTSFTEFVPINK